MIIALSMDRHFRDTAVETFGGEAVLCAGSFDEMRRKIQEKPDDVVLADLAHLQPFDITKIRCGVLALTGVPKFAEAVKLMRAGIRGYGNRMMMPENMRQAVNSVRSGQVWMPPFIISKLIDSMPAVSQKEEPETDVKLSDRETEVVKHVAAGLSNKEISEAMNITVRTVKAHLTSVFIKTGLRDRVAIALKYK